jgi:transposase
MPWTEQGVTDLRMCFVTAHQRGEEPLSALWARYGVSRKTGYKWLERYEFATGLQPTHPG